MFLPPGAPVAGDAGKVSGQAILGGANLVGKG